GSTSPGPPGFPQLLITINRSSTLTWPSPPEGAASAGQSDAAPLCGARTRNCTASGAPVFNSPSVAGAAPAGECESDGVVYIVPHRSALALGLSSKDSVVQVNCPFCRVIDQSSPLKLAFPGPSPLWYSTSWNSMLVSVTQSGMSNVKLLPLRSEF